MLQMNPNSVAEAVTYSCDISRKRDVIGMGKDIIQRFGRVDILVNNAGFGIYGKVLIRLSRI